MVKNNNTLLGVIICIKPSDIERVEEGNTIDTWYSTLPNTFVHGGWVQVVVSKEYYDMLDNLKKELELITTDLNL